ncbi:MAG: tRNA lysidine(34) synthetase TilS [Deltaproteobacteria bacterium]|nr:tRNA lysidine(34) synthetase TilS [Deltaproteobacteria bacterium]
MPAGVLYFAAMSGLIEIVKDTVREHGMLKNGDRVVAAVSGGVDSVVLLHALIRLRKEYGLKLTVCHLNHNLRGQGSRKDLEFVKRLSKRHGLRFIGKTLEKGSLRAKKGGSLQEAARDERYRFLAGALRKTGSNRLALGHTLDDVAETVLMRLIKGASLSGLSGIPGRRGAIIRPLIHISRAAIEDYAEKQGLRHCIDPTNMSPVYLRNSLRLELIPFIKERYNENIISTVARTASVLRKDSVFLDSLAQKAFKEADLRKGKGLVDMDRLKLLKMPAAISSRVFLMACRGLEKDADIIGAHVDAFFDIARSKRPNASYSLGSGLRIIREYGRIKVQRGRGIKKAQGFDLPLNIPGITRIPCAGAVIIAKISKRPPSARPPSAASFRSKDRAYFDYDEIPKPVIARSFRPGDRMKPSGMSGTKKLKAIFIDSKVQALQRQRTPVICAGDTIVWLAGIRRSDGYMVNQATKRVLMLEVRFS